MIVVDRNKLVKESSIGAKAQHILEDGLFIESFEQLKQSYQQELFNTSYKDSEQRTAIWIAWHQLDKVKGHLTELMETGKLASKQIEEIKKLK